VFSFNFSVYAESVDQDAVKKTQELLKNRESVKEITKKDAKAKNADDLAKQVAGSEEDTQELYNIAAEVLPTLLKMNNNDPEKAATALAEYSKNPEKFLSKLPKETRDKIKALSQKIESKQHKQP
ncbi:MAG: hypothetical protein KDD45_00750, partial [Bdellovibrionales bacterium]|nr:hypothetical protein [Bdellovibrionales bacterium]